MSRAKAESERKPFDAYCTPEWAIEALLEYVHVNGLRVLEPCAGDGVIVRVLESHGAMVTASDIRDGVDFLTKPFTERFDYVITNPPYRFAQEFATKAFDVADGVVMLLRLGFLAGQKRRMWWDEHRPTALYVLSRRPSFTGVGTDSADYAWVMWRSNNEAGSRLTSLRWLG